MTVHVPNSSTIAQMLFKAPLDHSLINLSAHLRLMLVPFAPAEGVKINLHHAGLVSFNLANVVLILSLKSDINGPWPHVLTIATNRIPGQPAEAPRQIALAVQQALFTRANPDRTIWHSLPMLANEDIINEMSKALSFPKGPANQNSNRAHDSTVAQPLRRHSPAPQPQDRHAHKPTTKSGTAHKSVQPAAPNAANATAASFFEADPSLILNAILRPGPAPKAHTAPPRRPRPKTARKTRRRNMPDTGPRDSSARDIGPHQTGARQPAIAKRDASPHPALQDEVIERLFQVANDSPQIPPPMEEEHQAMRAALRSGDKAANSVRIAAHAMNAALMMIALPVGSSMMTYSLLRGENLVASARLLAVVGVSFELLRATAAV